MPLESDLNIQNEVLLLLDEVLSLHGRYLKISPDTSLMGAVPELDSMAVVALLSAIEERFGFVIMDDEIDAATFATFGSLIAFLDGKLTANQ